MDMNRISLILSLIVILLADQTLGQSCKVSPLMLERVSCACSQTDYSLHNYGQSSSSISFPYTITGWIKAESVLSQGNVVYALYTTSGSRVFALHLSDQSSVKKVEIFGKGTNRIYINTLPSSYTWWIFTAITIYSNSFDLHIMRSFNPSDLVILSQVVTAPDFEQITSGYTLKTCSHRYETYYSFCGQQAYFSLYSSDFKSLSSDNKLRLMYSGGESTIIAKYQFTSFSMPNYEIDQSNYGHHIYQPAYQLKDNNFNQFSNKLTRPYVPISIHPIYPFDGDSFPYPGFTVSFWFYADSIATPTYLFQYFNEGTLNNLVSVSILNDPTNGYFKFCVTTECQQDGNTNPQTTWILLTFTLRNQQIQAALDGAFIEYYINGVFKKTMQFTKMFNQSAFERSVLNFSFTQTSSVYLKNMIITRGIMTELTGSTCLSSNNCSFSLQKDRCLMCSIGYSLTKSNSCDLIATCGSATLNKSYIKDINLNMCQEKCGYTCKDCDLPTRTCITCYDNTNTIPQCTCQPSKMYIDDMRGLCSDFRSDEHSVIRSQSESSFSNAGEQSKIVLLEKTDFQILSIVALTRVEISKNSGSNQDIKFYVKPQSDSPVMTSLGVMHYKNINIQMDALIYSYMINKVGQQSIIVKNILVQISSSNSLRVNGRGSYIYSFTHDTRSIVPFVSLFLTGYGAVKASILDIRLSYSAVSRTDMLIKIESITGDSPIYQVNICVVLSRFLVQEQVITIPSYISSYPTDYQGTRQYAQDFTVQQEEPYYVPFIYGLTSITYTVTQDLRFQLQVKQNTPISYRYSLDVKADTSIQYFSFSLLRFQPQKTAGSSLVECFPTCTQCSVSANTCLSCSDPLRTLPYCACQIGYFLQVDGTCAQCSQRCSECELTSQNCKVCKSNNTTPIPTCDCQAGFTYVGGNETVCQPCGNKCETCANSQNNCTKCFTGRVDFPNCSCPSGLFDDGISKACQTCPNECSQCTSLTNCSGCKDGYVLIGNQCQKCDYNCATCSAASTANCTTCQNDLRINPPSCVCKNGYFDSNNANPICLQCHMYCQTCGNSNTNCKSCNGNRVFDGINTCNCPSGSLNSLITSPFCEMCNLSGAVIEYSQDYSEVYIELTYPVIVNPSILGQLSAYSDLNCQEVLVQNVIDNLGQGYSCQLSADRKTFAIKLGYDSTISDNVQIKWNDLKLRTDNAACASNVFITQFAVDRVSKPNTSLPPVVVLSTNTQLFNVCSRIQIYIDSVTNSGGRSLKNYLWTEASNKINIQALQANQPILTLESNTLAKSTTYRFILSYTSSYDVSGQSSIQITTLDDLTSFQLTVLNSIDNSNTYKFSAYQGIQLKALIQLNSCVSNQDEFTVSFISWKQKFGNVNGKDLRSDTIQNTIISLSQAVFQYSVPPFLPVPKDKYEFEVETLVNYQGSDVSLKNSVFIEMVQRPLIVQILGGDTIRQWNKAFDLVANVYDPNSQSGFQNDNLVSISWTCTYDGTQQQCLWQDGTLFKDFAYNKLQFNVPERTFKYFQRIFLDVIVRRPNLDGTILQGTHSSEILFLDYELQSFSIQLPPQLASEYFSLSDKILFNINDSKMISQFRNSIDDLQFKTYIQYETQTYFSSNPLLSFSQEITIQHLFKLTKLNNKDQLKIVFSIDSYTTSTQYQTSYSVFAVDSPLNCQLSISNNAISVTSCLSNFLPLKYKFALYLSKKITQLEDSNTFGDHDYISLFGIPFSISNTFSYPPISITFDFISNKSLEEGYVFKIFTQDNQGSVSSQTFKIKNLTFKLDESNSAVNLIPTSTLISIATLIEYFNYPQQSTTSTFDKLMSKMRPFNEESTSHFNLYWAKKMEKYYLSQNQKRVLDESKSGSEKRNLQDQSVFTEEFLQDLLNNIEQNSIPQIFQFEQIWQNYKKFDVYHSQERLLFSTLRLLEQLIFVVSEDKLVSINNILYSLCQKAISLTQLNNQPLQYQGSVLNIYLAKYTNKLLNSELNIQAQNPTSSIDNPYEVIVIQQSTSRIFSAINSFPKGIQRSPIVSYHIRQGGSNIKLGDVHPVLLSATLGSDFDKSLAVCISYRQENQDVWNDIGSDQNRKWSASDCATVVQASGRDVICYCSQLDPVVLLEDTQHLFINTSDTDLHEMSDILKYPILILLLSQVLIYILFMVYAVVRDEIDLIKLNSTVVPYSLVLPTSAVNQVQIDKYNHRQDMLTLKEQDFEKKRTSLIQTTGQLQNQVNQLKDYHDKLLLQQNQVIANLQNEQKKKLDNQQKAYEAKIKELREANNTSFYLSEKQKQEKIIEAERDFKQQQQDLKQDFKEQQEEIVKQQKDKLKQIEDEEKATENLLHNEANAYKSQIKLDPEIEKDAPKNPIQRVFWLMKRGSQAELPLQKVSKQPLTSSRENEFGVVDASPLYINNQNSNSEKYPILSKDKQDNKNIVSLNQFDDAISHIATQVNFRTNNQPADTLLDPKFKLEEQRQKLEEQRQQLEEQRQKEGEYVGFTTQNNINFETKKNILIPLEKEVKFGYARKDEDNSRVVPLHLDELRPLTLECLLMSYFYIHELFSAIRTYENQISRSVRFTVLIMKYLMIAIIIGKVQNGQYSLNLIFSIPLAFLVSIISNVAICILKILIRSSKLKKAIGIILLFISFILLILFLTQEFLTNKSPAQSWWYAYLFAIAADFIFIEFIIILIKIQIFKSLYSKKQFYSNFDINSWVFISTNDITLYLTQKV